MLKSSGKLPIIVYSKRKSNRLNYILDFIFSFFDVEYELHSELSRRNNQLVINYSREEIDNSILIPSAQLLFEDGIELQELQPFHYNGFKTLYHIDKEADWPFDLFAASFYLISRYEEYLNHEKDNHGRYKIENSIAYRQGFIHQPLVDLWIKKFYEVYLADHNIKWVKAYQFIPTFDIDIAYSYKGKGIKRTWGGTVRDSLKLNFKNIIQRFSVISGNKKDPYDTYGYIIDQLKKRDLQSIFFIQCGKQGKYDKNLPIDSEEMEQLLSQLKLVSPIGIHPSYDSYLKKEIVKEEKDALQLSLAQSVKKNRQHYLRLCIPNSYQIMDEIGIKEDYSLGYASDYGFRASTAQPFYFFNLVNNQSSDLKVFPSILMDGTLKEYQKRTPEEAKMKIKKMIDEVKTVDGTFISIWHNSSFVKEEGWDGWKEVFEYLLDEGRK